MVRLITGVKRQKNCLTSTQVNVPIDHGRWSVPTSCQERGGLGPDRSFRDLVECEERVWTRTKGKKSVLGNGGGKGVGLADGLGAPNLGSAR